MKDLIFFANQCINELEAIDVPINNVVEWTVNTRAKGRWGQCRRKNGKYSINISSRLLEDDVTEKALKDTIVHELLHTIDGCMNHGTKWLMYAELVNDCYNYNVKRTSTDSDKGIDTKAEKMKSKYVFKCESCGQVVARDRASNFTKNYSNYGCARCHKPFVPIRYKGVNVYMEAV